MPHYVPTRLPRVRGADTSLAVLILWVALALAAGPLKAQPADPQEDVQEDVSALIQRLSAPDPAVRQAAARALIRRAEADLERRHTARLPDYERAYRILRRPATVAAVDREAAQALHRLLIGLRALDQLHRRRWLPSVEAWLRARPGLVFLGMGYSGLLAACLLLFWLRPLWLLHINDAIRPYADWTLPARLGRVRIPLQNLFLVGFFHYRPRVLDAWVRHRLPVALEHFHADHTVRERTVHIDLPVVFDDRVTYPLTPTLLREPFERNITRVLLCGEGGVGKTSLACRIARWAVAGRLTRCRMLPVLIEADFADFLQAVGAEVRALVDAPAPVPEALLLHLLRKKRLLVIVDRYSEMTPASRRALRVGAPDFPANALIVASRRREALDGRRLTVIEPLRIESDYLSEFVGAYLTVSGKRKLFPDSEYYPLLRRLSAMVRDRDVTPLLARLYADQMVASKEDGPAALPDSIPGLMLSYLNTLNRGARPGDPANPVVHRTARLIAWACLRATFRPIPARRDAVLTLLGRRSDRLLRYVEDRLRLVQTIGPAEDLVQFTLDPLAEYLAAMYVVEQAGGDAASWRRFLADADAMPEAPEAIRGFLRAVRDCCRTTDAGRLAPDFVWHELTVRLVDPRPPSPPLPPSPASNRTGGIPSEWSS